MRVGVMTTDGGPHPSDYWAEETAGEIMSLVKIDENSTSAAARKARSDKMRLEADIIEALDPVHSANMDHEKGQLAALGDQRLAHDYTPHPDHVDAGVEAVIGCARKYGEPFASAFDSDNGRQLVRHAIKVHFATAMHIERGWHADRKIAAGQVSDHVRAFKGLPAAA